MTEKFAYPLVVGEQTQQNQGLMLFSPLFVPMAMFAKHRKGGRYAAPMATISSTMALKFHSKQNHYGDT